MEVWNGISLIPDLSHLAFSDQEFVDLFSILLRTCSTLRVLIFLELGPPATLEQSELMKDHRFVSMRFSKRVTDWQMGAREGVDRWSRAQVFVAKRKSGEIGRTSWLHHYLPLVLMIALVFFSSAI